MNSELPLIVKYATCYEKDCSNRAVGLKTIGKNIQAAFCEDHIKE